MPPAKTKKAVSSVTTKLAATISDLSAALNLLIKRPLKDIKGVMRHESKQFSKPSKRKRKRFALLKLPLTIVVSLLSVLAKILLAPLELGAAIFQKKKSSRYLLFAMVPCCMLLIGWAGSSWMGFQNRQAISSLRTQANAAAKQKNFDKAVNCFDQLDVAKATFSPEEKFRWAQALSQSNQTDRANELLRELAPGQGQLGYAPAHQFAAISLVRTQQQPYSTDVKRLLNRHLKAGGELESPEVNFARSQYLISVEQFQPAIEAMTIAANAKPELNLILARLHHQVGDMQGEQNALALAQAEFEHQLKADSANHQARIALAKIYLRQRTPGLAEQQLRAGVELAPELFRPQLSTFFMQKFLSLPVTTSVEDKIDALENAWRNDWQNVATFQAAIRLYRQQDDDGRDQVLTALQQAAIEQPLAAMPHFTLGIVYRVEDRLLESKAAVEAAHQRLNPGQPGFSVVANNLAWLLAHDQQPDLEQAFRLADMAVSQNPTEGGLRDTLATVLMKQGRYQQALAEFQKALPTIRDKSPVHLKMAKIYDVLDQPKLAALHRNRSQPD